MFLRAVLAIGMLAIASLPALADVELSVDLGWGGAYRSGVLNPVFMTLRDPGQVSPREALLEITSRYDTTNSVRFKQHVAISASASTYLVYCRVSGDLGQ